MIKSARKEFAEKGFMKTSLRTICKNAEEDAEHEETTALVIHQMYLHREEILLVLTKSQGTKYENIADLLIWWKSIIV